MTKSECDFYVQQSRFSDPGKFTSLYDDLPDDIGKLCDVVHGLITHIDNTEWLYHYKIGDKQKQEVNTRYVKSILELIMKKVNLPLAIRRPPRRRFYGSCRDYALLLCSILRYKGIPSRVRNGFTLYLDPSFHWDHFICEYWNRSEKRWVFVDPNVGKEERHSWGVTVDNLDIPRDEFLVGGKAWQLCRKGKLDHNLCGIKEPGIQGWWFVRRSIMLDLLNLNKEELLPWDDIPYSTWQFYQLDRLAPEELKYVDTLSTEVLDDIDFPQMRRFYRVHPELQMPNWVTCNTLGKIKRVDLALS
jgi:hypothetical protein